MYTKYVQFKHNVLKIVGEFDYTNFKPLSAKR